MANFRFSHDICQLLVPYGTRNVLYMDMWQDKMRRPGCRWPKIACSLRWPLSVSHFICTSRHSAFMNEDLRQPENCANAAWQVLGLNLFIETLLDWKRGSALYVEYSGELQIRHPTVVIRAQGQHHVVILPGVPGVISYLGWTTFIWDWIAQKSLHFECKW